MRRGQDTLVWDSQRQRFLTCFKEDGLVKSRFSLPWWEGIKGRGGITFSNTVTYHPHPNPPPSRGRRFRTFYEIIKEDTKKNLEKLLNSS